MAPNLEGGAAKPLNDAFNAVMAAYSVKHPTAPATISLSEAQIKDVFNALVPDFDRNVTSLLPAATSLKSSREYLALMSLSWANPGKMLGGKLKEALATGNRAEAWFQIRYGSNFGWQSRSVTSGTGGVAKRPLHRVIFVWPAQWHSGDGRGSPQHLLDVDEKS